ncbi:MAG: NAD(P)/FAD-dependent oxidoreductase [Psychroflexus sp.]|uniref:NAD(P)/FAD-dependent oxidoreductase n=1 Tax=Psychroflexus sp. S27 TaxID=1982757 RepID=UPI000C2B3311|nr:FAD/NAD(P)-binding oxidoreductase [Psychroflexus sp. S27]PJX22767.1 FAD-dependent oxidoreductase [Psychroflexus sp. S27]
MVQEHVIIIGNGIAGVTAARHIRKLSDKRITIISSESEYFFSRTALMYVYMGHMKWNHLKPYEDQFWKKNRINLLKAYVTEISPEDKSIKLEDGRHLQYTDLIIATGSEPQKFGWKGQEAHGVQGLYSKQDLELLEKNAPHNRACKRAIIVGGGLIGIELAEMLSTRDIPVTFLVREKHFWNNVLPKHDAQLVDEHIRKHQIDLRLETNLDEILTDENGKVRAVKIKETGETIQCDLVGLTTGVKPRLEMLSQTSIETNRGVLVNPYLKTNYDNIYAIGDCAEQREVIKNRPSIEAVWYTGKMMGETVAQTICGKPMKYNPGHWFNSAKFFDIEYQTYGWVYPEEIENNRQLHWSHPDGTKAMTVNFNQKNNQFIGINTFGIRLRHEVVNGWLEQNKTILEVMKNLKQANFDPEFFQSYEKDIFKSYQKHL